MINKKSILAVLLCYFSFVCQAGTEGTAKRRPFYIGVTGGYGFTTWNALVPEDKTNLALEMALPSSVKEGGGLWGAFAGYELFSRFALETSYTRYPDATLNFSPNYISLKFEKLFLGVTDVAIVTHTETIAIVGKFSIDIPHTTLKAYSSIGGAGLHRKDILLDDWHFTPTFNIGLDYDISPRIFAEIGANYTAGFGEALVNPAEGYFPFLYSVFARLALRF